VTWAGGEVDADVMAVNKNKAHHTIQYAGRATSVMQKHWPS